MPRGKRKGADPTAEKLDKRACHLCKRQFTPDTSSRYFCSDECAAASFKRRNEAENERWRVAAKEMRARYPRGGK